MRAFPSALPSADDRLLGTPPAPGAKAAEPAPAEVETCPGPAKWAPCPGTHRSWEVSVRTTPGLLRAGHEGHRTSFCRQAVLGAACAPTWPKAQALGAEAAGSEGSGKSWKQQQRQPHPALSLVKRGQAQGGCSGVLGLLPV